MNKERIKGVAIGFILCLLLSASVLAVSAQTATRNITYGIRVNLNGQEVHFDHDNRPFTMEGRTFLPLRALADVLGLPVDFDRHTNTVYLGNRFEGQRRSLNEAAPFFDTTSRFLQGFNVGVTPSITMGNATMSGVMYNNTIRFSTRSGSMAHNDPTIAELSTLHNLGGNYRWLSGYIGRIDGSASTSARLRIYGDGSLLAEHELNALDMPTEIGVFVEGITQLRIVVRTGQFRWRDGATGTFNYALQAFLE